MAKQRCVTVNAVAMFCGVRGSTYRPYLCTGTRDRARHVASRHICLHIHVLCMPACVLMSARPRSGSPHDDLHRSSYYTDSAAAVSPPVGLAQARPNYIYILLGERERAHLVLRLGSPVYMYIYNYIYIYNFFIYGTTDRIPYISKCFYALLFHRHLSTFHGTQYGPREAGLLQRREGASRH